MFLQLAAFMFQQLKKVSLLFCYVMVLLKMLILIFDTLQMPFMYTFVLLCPCRSVLKYVINWSRPVQKFMTQFPENVLGPVHNRAYSGKELPTYR